MLSVQIVVVSSLASILSSILALSGLYFWSKRRAAREAPATGLADAEGVVFLFDGRTLVDATPKARAQLPGEPAESDDWGRFIIAFSYRFEDLEGRLRMLPTSEQVEITEVPADPHSLRLVASDRDGLTQIALVDPLKDQRSELVEHYSLAAVRAELHTLRSVAERAPSPTWKQRTDGTIVWANTAYMTLTREIAGEAALFGWPPPDVFAQAHVARTEADGTKRVAIQTRGSTPQRWFDLTLIEGEIETLCFATPVDKLVRAESALSEFVQTLTKTFAHLTIGLAIFDRKRQLALFNPALVDLTGLPPEQLSCRPSLHAFLDALRDCQRIPEPKDYKSWRLHIAQLEADAANGTYEEIWHLPSGQTYRVTGRPHPDGAVAYVFEDISSEVSMTRSFRSEIELSQSVLDNLDVAVAAFTQDGVLNLTNRAYRQLWKSDPGTGLAETGIMEATALWQSLCQPDPVWEEIRRTVLRTRERPGWSGLVHRQDLVILHCDVRPLSRGGTLVSFRVLTQIAEPQAEKIAPEIGERTLAPVRLSGHPLSA